MALREPERGGEEAGGTMQKNHPECVSLCFCARAPYPRAIGVPPDLERAYGNLYVRYQTAKYRLDSASAKVLVAEEEVRSIASDMKRIERKIRRAVRGASSRRAPEPCAPSEEEVLDPGTSAPAKTGAPVDDPSKLAEAVPDAIQGVDGAGAIAAAATVEATEADVAGGLLPADASSKGAESGGDRARLTRKQRWALSSSGSAKKRDASEAGGGHALELHGGEQRDAQRRRLLDLLEDVIPKQQPEITEA